MTDLSHLNAIKSRLNNTIVRRNQQKTIKARNWFDHEIKMIEKELAGEYKFLNINPGDEINITVADIDAHFGFVIDDKAKLTDEELLAELLNDPLFA